MKSFNLGNPYPNGFKYNDDQKALVFLEVLREIKNKAEMGEDIYIKILSGDYTGSIGKFIPERMEENIVYSDRVYTQGFNYTSGYRLYFNYKGRIKWDGKRNNIECYFSHNFEYLTDYKGPTILQKIDKKKEREKLLESTKQYDINGRELKIGDEVLYVNIRYGSGMQLQHGKILRFEAKVNSQVKKTFVIVGNKKNLKLESKIEHPSDLIYLKEGK